MLNKIGDSSNTWKLLVLKASESCPDHSTDQQLNIIDVQLGGSVFIYRDELLSGMTKLDEQLDMYLGSLKQLKMLDLSTEELKDQQETLQAAISNPQHPLHTVQAK